MDLSSFSILFVIITVIALLGWSINYMLYSDTSDFKRTCFILSCIPWLFTIVLLLTVTVSALFTAVTNSFLLPEKILKEFKKVFIEDQKPRQTRHPGQSEE